jgi:hypothetical protein
MATSQDTLNPCAAPQSPLKVEATGFQRKKANQRETSVP